MLQGKTTNAHMCAMFLGVDTGVYSRWQTPKNNKATQIEWLVVSSVGAKGFELRSSRADTIKRRHIVSSNKRPPIGSTPH